MEVFVIGNGLFGLDDFQMKNAEDLGDGVYSSVLGRPERTGSMDEPEEDADIVLLDDGEGVYVSCLDCGTPLSACAEMVLSHFGIHPDGESIPVLADELCLSEMEVLFFDSGLATMYYTDADMDLLLDAIENDESVICFVSGLALRHPELEMFPGITDCSAVSLVGFDFSNPFSVRVIVNDPNAGQENTAWELSEFLRAWTQENRSALIVRRRDLV